MSEHRWSGFLRARCLDCGCSDPREVANGGSIDKKLLECPEPRSGRYLSGLQMEPMPESKSHD